MTLLILAIITPLVPLTVLYVLARSRPRSSLEWLVNVAIATSLVVIIHVIGTWVFLSYYLRYLILAIFVGVVGSSLLAFSRRRAHDKVAREPVTAPPGKRARLTNKTILAALALVLAFLALRGHGAPYGTIDLAFPLKGGTYCIIQGGSNFVTNPFHNFVDSEHALDIVRINRFGNRASGLVPKQLERYAIYGDTVYSPCDGVVRVVQDTIPDNIPPRANHLAALGNHVDISTDGVRIVLAHLMEASIIVTAGDTLKRSQPVARVGNSGYSNEPHLHIQALRHEADDGLHANEPLPIRFAGRYVAINDLIIR